MYVYMYIIYVCIFCWNMWLANGAQPSQAAILRQRIFRKVSSLVADQVLGTGGSRESITREHCPVSLATSNRIWLNRVCRSWQCEPTSTFERGHSGSRATKSPSGAIPCGQVGSLYDYVAPNVHLPTVRSLRLLTIKTTYFQIVSKILSINN